MKRALFSKQRDLALPEWLVEEGIGEQRAILMDGGQIRAARLHWPGALAAGQVEEAVVVSAPSGQSGGRRRGLARFASGEEALIDRLPGDVSEGARLRLEVRRAALMERGRYKRALVRPAGVGAPLSPPPSLAEMLGTEDYTARIVPHFPDNTMWESLWADAWQGRYEFAGGSLELSPTPAMTVIDVDGTLPAASLALSAAAAAAQAIRLMDIAGNIVIDFPSLATKAERRAIDEALALGFGDYPHEATAMNGFGLVQLAAKLTRPSLLHRLHFDRSGAAVRLLLRRAEVGAKPGHALQLHCHPAIAAQLSEKWLTELARRAGLAGSDQIEIITDPTLALESGFAQSLSR